VTIAVPTSGGWTFEAQLEEDEWHMLWLVRRHGGTGKRQLWIFVSAALKNNWHIVNATPAERELLAAHRFASGRVQ